jgi:hypothetical protein
MGACSFSVSGEAWTAGEAFRLIHDEAKYQHGHGGYSGTIAEKHDFRLVRGPTVDRESPEWKAWYDAVEQKNEKWGPAECVVLREPEEVPRMTKARAQALALERFGPTAVVKINGRAHKDGRRRAPGTPFEYAVHAEIRAVSDKSALGCNTRLPNGKWEVSVAQASGKDAAEAYGRLFAKKGLYLFFGWASS